MKEIWTDVEGYEGLYQVSNLGRVKTLSKKHWCASRTTSKKWYYMAKEKVLKGQISNAGYRLVGLTKDLKCKVYSVHRLVAIAFIPNPNMKEQVNHKDGDKLNNNVDNLEWATRSENTIHALRSGLMKKRVNYVTSEEAKIKQRISAINRRVFPCCGKRSHNQHSKCKEVKI